MKLLHVILFLFFPCFFWAQAVDTSIIENQIDSLIKISRKLTSEREFEKAMHINEIAEKLALDQFGKMSVAYGKTCFNHARVLGTQNIFKEAEEWYLKSIHILEQTLGEKNYEVTKNYNNLGSIYRRTGKFKEAEQLYLKAKNIREQVLGKKHRKYASILENLAILYSQLREYEKAEPLYAEAIAIIEDNYGTGHPSYLRMLSNLAITYENMGLYEHAKKYYKEVKKIHELNPNNKISTSYAQCIRGLGSIYSILGDIEKGESLLLQSIALIKESDGDESLIYANYLNALGTLYQDMGKYDKAAHFYSNSLLIFDKKRGKINEASAAVHVNLGNLFWIKEDYTQAENHLQQALIIEDSLFGKSHPNQAENLLNLSLVYWSIGKMEEAEKLLTKLNHIEKESLLKAAYHLSQKEINAFMASINNKHHWKYSFSQLHGGFTASNYDNTLFYKGYLLNAFQQINRLTSSDSTTAQLYQQLQSCHSTLAKMYSSPKVKRQITVEIEEKANKIEKDIVKRVANFQNISKNVDWENINAALKKNEAAIEFIHFNYRDPHPIDSIMYAALILSPKGTEPIFIPLFEERQIKKGFHSASSSGEPNPQQGVIKQFYTTRGFVKDKNPNHKNLYQLIWEPLDSLLQDVETIYFSPSGLLHRINMAAIAIDSTTILGDRYLLRQLNSTRNLVIPPTITPANNDITLYGGIHYESLLKSPAADIIFNNDSTEQYKSSLTFSNLTREWRGGTWNYLPGTEKETNVIARIMSEKSYTVNLVQGHAATEEAFKQIGEEGPSPRILHIATHGFFFPDPVDTLQRHRLIDDEPVFKLSDNPMIRSGLLLAGANHAWSGGEVSEEAEDGILTAYEISQMNLSNTELVVLSACETGLGDIDGNEGVYGLQRAFKIAGAKYLIMSLWQVPDLETSEFMQTFYREWLGGKSIHEAFAFAQRHMRELNADPYFWGGVVLVE